MRSHFLYEWRPYREALWNRVAAGGSEAAPPLEAAVGLEAEASEARRRVPGGRRVARVDVGRDAGVARGDELLDELLVGEVDGVALAVLARVVDDLDTITS